MASYIPYWKPNSSSTFPSQQAQRDQPATSIWSVVTSRFTTLRKGITGDSEEDSNEHEDLSHVANVLREYYMQKKKALPSWLPRDPRAKEEISTQGYSQYGNMPANMHGDQYGNRYGTQQGDPYGAPTHTRGNSGGRGGGLNDIFNSDSTTAPPPQSQSLRSPRPTMQQLRSHEGNARSTASSDPYSSQTLQPSSAARPLPSQRAGSFQNTAAAGAPPRAVDRFRSRPRDGGSGRSSPTTSSGTLADSNPYGTQQSSGGNLYPRR